VRYSVAQNKIGFSLPEHVRDDASLSLRQTIGIASNACVVVHSLTRERFG
jgi:hypothetical protein